MPIIKNAEIWFAKLDPKKPATSFNPDGQWEVQIRTSSKKQADEWKTLFLKPKMDQDEDGKTFWRVNLKKKAKKADGTAVAPVKVVNGALEDLDPTTIGNGSVGNIRIFQYPYEIGKGKAKKEGTASMLMAIQLTKHIVYVPPKRDDEFDMEETETVNVSKVMGDDEDDPDNDSEDQFDDTDDKY